MNKKGILVVSFGSTYAVTREKCIEPLEKEIAQTFEDYHFYRAFTSPTVRKILKERDNIYVPSIEEALEKMWEDGITYCVVQPTHLLWGYETEYLHQVAKGFLTRIPVIHIGNPLLYEEGDYKAVIDTLGPMCHFSQITVFVGHGTSHKSDEVYDKLWKKFRQYGYDNVYIGTVEGDMDAEFVVRQLRNRKLKDGKCSEIVLHPLLLVAGEHANKDIGGETSDSWKNRLEKEGFQVNCILKGLGEYENIRKIYIQHALQIL